MPRITNNTTGVSYVVSTDELKKLKEKYKGSFTRAFTTFEAEEPEILRHQTDVSTFNTKYGINKTADSYEKIPIAKNKYSSVTQQRGSKLHYKNIRDLK